MQREALRCWSQLSEAPLAEQDLDYLLELADWLTSTENRRFARTQVNRVWHHLMGRGIVDPIDGTRAFVRGWATWSVLLGIEWQGVPVVGLAYMPAAPSSLACPTSVKARN